MAGVKLGFICFVPVLFALYTCHEYPPLIEILSYFTFSYAAHVACPVEAPTFGVFLRSLLIGYWAAYIILAVIGESSEFFGIFHITIGIESEV